MTRRSSAFAGRLTLALAAALLAGRAHGENMDPASIKIYAWSENAGWLNTRPNGAGANGMHVGDYDVRGWLWAENAGWVSLSCRSTSSCATTSYGVANDGHGVLSGFAWSENAGWINLAGVTINPATGIFAGSAWSENLGWISFANAGANPFQVQTTWRCSPPPAAPTGSPLLALTKSVSATTLSWSGIAGATAYDVVRGDLNVLRATGSYVASTQQCLANDTLDATLSDTATPPAGTGYWYLVRGVNCGSSGTFDSGSPKQLGSRDPGIGASSNRCP